MAPRKKTTLVQCLCEIEDPKVGNGKRHDLVEVQGNRRVRHLR